MRPFILALTGLYILGFAHSSFVHPIAAAGHDGMEDTVLPGRSQSSGLGPTPEYPAVPAPVTGGHSPELPSSSYQEVSTQPLRLPTATVDYTAAPVFRLIYIYIYIYIYIKGLRPGTATVPLGGRHCGALPKICLQAAGE
jgi:hypothetical protein